MSNTVPNITTEEVMNDRITPRWARDIYRLLPIKSQYILSGNIRDSFLIKNDSCGYQTVSLLELLWRVLQSYGFKRIEVYDPIGMVMQAYPPDSSTSQSQMLLTEFTNKITSKLDGQDRIAMVIDFASRIAHNDNLFPVCDKLATRVTAKVIQGDTKEISFYNPLIWLFNKDGDIPPWYGKDNHRLYRQEIPRPDLDQRLKIADTNIAFLSKRLGQDIDDESRKAYSKIFAGMSDGFTLSEMSDVAKLAAISKNIELHDIDDAVRSYKTGDPTLDNPWKSGELRKRINNADEAINKQVRGQQTAVRHALDILKRSVMGLTGAQTSSSNNRPRGVLFLAGPTGVGKTELAKSLTYQLFQDNDAIIRFDMSEFSQEHSDARLLGAPPGYVGYEGGGELVNAIRQRPFSLLLFDEIEKANGKILDKFLQILEDGRITSGKGETVYFSECIIVFTSNLGIMREEQELEGGRIVVKTKPVVTWEDDYATVNKEVRAGITAHFNTVLKRPELLNRLGNNIVVFDFINPEVADEIYGIMIDTISERIVSEHHSKLVLSDSAKEFLRCGCKVDLSHGGRGIGNCLETMLINPLARELFKFEPQQLKNKTVTVTNVHSISATGADAESYEVEIQVG